jgi:hypothetical protein
MVSGPGLTALETWAGTDFVGEELNDAEVSPTKATSRAKTRTATFIFSNLTEFEFAGV